MNDPVTMEKPPCPTCSGYHGKNGRPRNKIRPEVRLSVAYVSKLGARCGDMAETVQRAASRAVSDHEARELAMVGEQLMQMKEMFV